MAFAFFGVACDGTSKSSEGASTSREVSSKSRIMIVYQSYRPSSMLQPLVRTDYENTNYHVLAHGQLASLSRDGHWMAYWRQKSASGSAPLYVYNIATGDVRRLIDDSQAPVLWVRDKNQLVTLTRAKDEREALMIVSVETGLRRTLAWGGIYRATINPSGEKIVYAATDKSRQTSNLFMTETNGSGTRQISRDGRSTDPLWGPRNEIVYKRYSRVGSVAYTLWLMRFEKGYERRREIAQTAKGTWEAITWWPRNSNRILLEKRSDNGSGPSVIYSYSINTNKLTRIMRDAYLVTGAQIGRNGEHALISDNKPRSLVVELKTGRVTKVIRNANGAFWND